MKQENYIKEKLKDILLKSNVLDDQSFEVLDENDSFGFTCKRCGACCMNRDDIILNPYDCYKAAKALDIPVADFITKYTYPRLGSDSKVPMVLLKSQDNGFCGLLEFDTKEGGVFKCKIHDSKPGACVNHPIGVVFRKDLETGESTGFQYVKISQCPNSVSTEMHLVKDWVKSYIDNSDKIELAFELQGVINEFFNPRAFYVFFRSLIDSLSMTENAIKNVLSEEEIPEIAKTMIQLSKEAKDIFDTYLMAIYNLYNYDISQPFVPQAEEKLADIRLFLKSAKDLYEAMKELTSSLFGFDVNKMIEETEKTDEAPFSIEEV